MENNLEGKRIKGYNEENKVIEGIVQLVYLDALASGTRDYVNMTYLSVMDDEGKVHEVKPRNVIEVLEIENKNLLIAISVISISIIVGAVTLYFLERLWK